MSSSPSEYPQGVRPPQQGRSEETFERILQAAEELLDGRDFEDIPILEIADAAEVSSSSLYARFPTKAVLLRCLHERHMARMQRQADAVIASGAWDSLSLEAIIRQLLVLYLAHRRTREGLLRTFELAAVRDSSFVRRRQETDSYIVRAIHAYLVARMEPAGPDLRAEKVELVVRVLCAGLQDAINAPDCFAKRLHASDEWLIAELARMGCRYLGISTP